MRVSIDLKWKGRPGSSRARTALWLSRRKSAADWVGKGMQIWQAVAGLSAVRTTEATRKRTTGAGAFSVCRFNDLDGRCFDVPRHGTKLFVIGEGSEQSGGEDGADFCFALFFMSCVLRLMHQVLFCLQYTKVPKRVNRPAGREFVRYAPIPPAGVAVTLGGVGTLSSERPPVGLPNCQESHPAEGRPRVADLGRTGSCGKPLAGPLTIGSVVS